MSLKCDCPKRSRWYFGPVSGVMASCITFPIDVVKVQLQTQHNEKVSILKLTQKIVREQGMYGFFNGLTGAIVRHLTATITRVGIYESGKNHLDADSLTSRVLLATFAGAIGGVVGLPTTVVTIRMQNDIKLPPELRRNYKNAIDGIKRVYHEEGFHSLFVGGYVAVTRLVLLTIGQNVVYDQAKSFILTLPHFTEDLRTHLSASIVAALATTMLIQPLDVIAVRAMNAKQGEYRNIMDVVFKTAREGPLVFYRGFLPASIGLGPNTILLLLFMEQLRKHLGYTAKDSRCCGPEFISVSL